MINAHLRFGHLTYTRVTRKTTTQFRVPLDRLIAENAEGQLPKLHLVSVVGGDTQIAALHAAITAGDSFTVETPAGTRFSASLGQNSECYRGSLKLAQMERPLRHLVAVSEEIAGGALGPGTERTILVDDSAAFVWNSLVQIHGLPGAPDWAGWLLDELRRRGKVQGLESIGCNAVLIHATKGMLLNAIRRGLRQRRIGFPKENGPADWPSTPISRLLSPTPEQQ
jgi:hypothetical protein